MVGPRLPARVKRIMSEPHPRSYWAATALQEPVPPKLTADTEAETIIIGGGFTGLSAAYHLVAAGRDCIVLESNEIGWGASGRNGGMVVPRYKHTYPLLATRYGAPTALAMYRAAHRAVDLIDRIVTAEAIDCGFSRCGHLTPYVHAADARRFEADAAWLAREAADGVPQILSREETATRIGTSIYAGAYFEPRGGEIHPLRFCQGLARAVLARGGRIHAGTRVQAWRREGDGVVVEVAGARARGRRLLIATNGYTDTAPAGDALARRIVPVASSLIATAPLSDAMRRDILPLKNVVTDAKRLTNYYRITPDGRMVFGGRGGASSAESMAVYRRLAGEMERIFPQLRGVAVDHRWSGRVAVNLDGLPRVGRLYDNVLYAMGYNGRGVALSILLGRMLAEDDLSADKVPSPLAAAFDPIRFHALQVPGKKIVTTYYRVLDALGL